MISNIEHILTIPRKTLDDIGEFQGFTPLVEPYLEAFFAIGVTKFLPRHEAEKDPSHKQLIPYCILTNNNKILCYKRGKKGGEKRLAAKLSIGIGGHINPIDLDAQEFDEVAYNNCVTRELYEELEFEKEPIEKRIVGLINDDSNEVGKVHLGVIQIFDFSSRKISPKEDAIVSPEFLTIQELIDRRDELETWSQIAIDNIKEILPIRTYTVGCGNANKNSLELVGETKAKTKSEAIENIKTSLPDSIALETKKAEYLHIYFNPDNITEKVIKEHPEN